jgi:hypothetical protein
MKLQSGKTQLELAPKDVLLLNNVLNEVCNGFEVSNFDEVIGAPIEDVNALLDRIRDLSAGRHSTLSVSKRDLDMLHNALCETLRELRIEEFLTRTGVEFGTAKRNLATLQAVR